MEKIDLIEAVTKFLEREGWSYEFDEEESIFASGIGLQCKLKKCDIVIVVDKDIIICYTTIDVSADEGKRAEVSEFITRANYGLRYGNFEMDFEDGEIRYKTVIDCESGVPSPDCIERSVVMPALMFDRYGDGLLSVLFGFASAKSAIEVSESEIE